VTCKCPYCARLIKQDRNVEGLNYCTSCGKLFLMPPLHRVPSWVLGVLVILMGNWQLICHL